MCIRDSFVSAAENQTAVTDVNATDADGDTLTYSISGGADQARFAIDSATGVLTFATAPDYEANASAAGNNDYLVEVTATDDGAGALTDLQAITVTVIDVNDAPVITTLDGNATSYVSDAENKTAVTDVNATAGEILVPNELVEAVSHLYTPNRVKVEWSKAEGATHPTATAVQNLRPAENQGTVTVSYTHLPLPTTPYV